MWLGALQECVTIYVVLNSVSLRFGDTLLSTLNPQPTLAIPSRQASRECKSSSTGFDPTGMVGAGMAGHWYRNQYCVGLVCRHSVLLKGLCRCAQAHGVKSWGARISSSSLHNLQNSWPTAPEALSPLDFRCACLDDMGQACAMQPTPPVLLRTPASLLEP